MGIIVILIVLGFFFPPLWIVALVLFILRVAVYRYDF